MRIFKNLFGKNDHKIHVDEIAVGPNLLLGNAVIIDSHIETNSGWVRFGNGIMFLWDHIVVENVAPDSIALESGIDFVKPFTVTPTILSTNLYSYSSTHVFRLEYAYARPTSPQQWEIRFRVGSANATQTYRFRIFAIGRWK